MPSNYTSNYNKYLPWFALRDIPGVGNHLFKRLIDRFGSPNTVFNASEDSLKEVKGISRKTVKAILRFSAFKQSKQVLKRIEDGGFNLTAMTDQEYPPLLKELPDPPPVLTYIGKLNPMDASIAVVGARKATSYGIDAASKLSHDLAKQGFLIVSGMARGIDTAAHKGALKAGGKTVAVLGSGLNNIYPSQNKKLASSIAENGAVISEFKPDAIPAPRHFPVRNRIIAGMSCGTIVVEAASRSGAAITARLTADYGRELFAVPGSIFSFNSIGTHSLIKQGAKLVENYSDVIDELHHMVHPVNSQQDKIKKAAKGKSTTQNLDGSHRKILAILEPYPLHIDVIIEKSGLDPGDVFAVLLDLEMSGMIRQTPGKQFSIPGNRV